MISTIYHTVLYQPLYNILVFFYNIVPGHDIGLAIIMLTVVVKLILWPFFSQSIKAQRSMQAIQPKIDELKEKYKDDKQKLGPALMELYKKEKVSPFASCLPLLLQLPFLIAVYKVFSVGLSNGSLDAVYPFIYNPGTINPISLGMINLSEPSIIMAVLAGLSQFWQSKLMFARQPQNDKNKNSTMAIMNKQMTYFMPLITVFIGASLPAGLTLYWLVITVLGVAQQTWVFKKMDNKVEIVNK
ncbi:MAG: YidC/Oxa1 family membrane protein insertase [Candidatus Komeilibacteria bacterium]|nr:YidC/Oxa1 family membrane protein insertase [Candidatus Komeilibacteria bacterium]